MPCPQNREKISTQLSLQSNNSGSSLDYADCTLTQDEDTSSRTFLTHTGTSLLTSYSSEIFWDLCKTAPSGVSSLLSLINAESKQHCRRILSPLVLSASYKVSHAQPSCFVSLLTEVSFFPLVYIPLITLPHRNIYLYIRDSSKTFSL